MHDLISRQAAIDALCSVCGVDCDKSEFVYGGKQEDQVILCPEHYVLTQLPSAQPRKGKWHGKGDSEGFGIFICDNCGKFAMMEFDFCPNCGADMRQRSDSE